jgi:hypothetical protein
MWNIEYQLRGTEQQSQPRYMKHRIPIKGNSSQIQIVKARHVKQIIPIKGNSSQITIQIDKARHVKHRIPIKGNSSQITIQIDKETSFKYRIQRSSKNITMEKDKRSSGNIKY